MTGTSGRRVDHLEDAIYRRINDFQNETAAR